MVNFWKLVVLLVAFAGAFVGINGFIVENTQPVLITGWGHRALVYAAAFLLGPAVAVAGGVWGRDHLMRDFEEVTTLAVPGTYSLIASLIVKYPVVYFLFLSIVCAGVIGFAAWGATVQFERRHSVAAGEVRCATGGVRAMKNSPPRLKLECPVDKRPVAIELLIREVPEKLPREVDLPVSKSVLGTLFVNGTNFQF